jgi:transcriptional regulator with XRE-family HTH domain
MAEQGLSAAKVAEMTGFDRSYVWKVRKGHRPGTVQFIANVVAVSGGAVDPATFLPAPSPSPRAA